MRFSLGISQFFLRRGFRRLGALGSVLGAIAGVFTFTSTDLARKDAHFSPDAVFINDEFLPSNEKRDFVHVELNNISEHEMKNLDVSFAFYNSSGDPIRILDPDFVEDGVPISHFAPTHMTIAPRSAKYAALKGSDFGFPLEDLSSIVFCAVFDGSFWVDRVKETVVLTNVGVDWSANLGQLSYSKDISYISEPKCKFPKKLVVKDSVL